MAVIRGVICANEASISQYQKIIQLTEGLDYVTQDMVIDLLSDERELRRLFLELSDSECAVYSFRHMAYQKKDRLLERYLKYLEVERNASPRTVVAYRHALAKFKLFAGDKISWADCTAQQFRGFLLDCMKNGMARSYVRLTFAALRSFYKYLVEREGFRDNPLREVQLPKMEKKLPIVLSVSQVDELLTAPEEG